MSDEDNKNLPWLVGAIIIAAAIFAFLIIKILGNKPESLQLPVENEVQVNQQNEMDTYKDDVAGFSFEYPKNWYVDTVYETTTKTFEDSSVVHSGKLIIRNNDSEHEGIFFTYGDEYVGDLCGEANSVYVNGTLSRVSIGGESASMCKIFTKEIPNAPGYEQEPHFHFAGDCRECSTIQKKDSYNDKTSYIIAIKSIKEDFSETEFQKILDSLTFFK